MVRFLRLDLMLACVSILLAAATATSAQQVNSPDVTVVADHASGIYHAGDVAHFTVEWKGADPAPTDAHYTLKSGGLTQLSKGDLKFVNNKATVDAKLDQPDTVLVSVTWATGGPGNLSTAGAVADPDQIKPDRKSVV